MLVRRLFSSSAAPLISLRSTKLRDVARENVQSSKKNDTPTSDSRQPISPARTRFAPSPTGFVHIGSLRTALYNYLLAHKTKGQFLLRLEDTDQNRLVEGAEQNIYDALKWAGLTWDEGPDVGGPYGPYRQSERSDIYSQYASQLIDSGHAYRCFCSKHRLDGLRDSARKLHPPSMASYDRKCTTLSSEESESRAASGESHTVRFKSPHQYPPFEDLLHGKVDAQTQVNYGDLRYEDPVLVKSDGLPTYHLANVVDDHLMKITHVVRGEEWLLSTPKHCALYDAFGWTAPKFVHIPLLTSMGDKKLSKRSGDVGISQMAASGILPEALINFVALFGWSPHTPGNETFTLKELEPQFSLDGLTKGNAKVDNKKLMHFNQVYWKRRLEDAHQLREVISECHARIQDVTNAATSDVSEAHRTSILRTTEVFNAVKDRISSPVEFEQFARYFYETPLWQKAAAGAAIADSNPKIKAVLLDAQTIDDTTLLETELLKLHNKKHVFTALRFALAGSVSGAKIADILSILGDQVVKSRIAKSLNYL